MAEEAKPERTLVLVKPDGVARGLAGEIVARFEKKGLKIVAARLLLVSPELAARHYAEHIGKPFYEGLLRHITSGPTLALAVEGPGAIATVRLMVGATNPQTAAPGTIRGDLAISMTPNLVHASDSPASAERELGLYFERGEYLAYQRTDHEFT